MLEAWEAVIETNDKYESGRGDILTIETCIYILDNECVTELPPENIMTASSGWSVNKGFLHLVLMEMKSQLLSYTHF